MQLYVKDRHVVKKNGQFLRVQVALFGHAKLCDYERLEFYAFRCPVHGLATDYARGHDRYLECSYCMNG